MILSMLCYTHIIELRTTFKFSYKDIIRLFLRRLQSQAILFFHHGANVWGNRQSLENNRKD